jgi:hypothetical protein
LAGRVILGRCEEDMQNFDLDTYWKTFPYASSSTAPFRCMRDGDREVPLSLTRVHRLLCTFASRGARLITGAVFALERPLVDRW